MRKTLKWGLAQQAELKWWENYLKGKDVDQYHTWKKNYWKGLLDIIQPVCPIVPDMEILDAGCGPAGVFMNLAGCRVDAVDPLIDSYEQKLPHFRKVNYPWTEFFNVPIEQYRTGKKYDIVFCMNAINHVSDIQFSYELLAGMVKPGGKIVVTIDAHNYSFFKHLFRIIPGDILHPHQYDLHNYERFLTDRGFKILLTNNLKNAFILNHYIQVGQKLNDSDLVSGKIY
jgi:2-polyprenyl-6-hydroxyphenyl methylase/3-demethylubiquinone-9 3-methyltransferase